MSITTRKVRYSAIMLLLSSVTLQGCTQNAYTGERQASRTGIGAGAGAAGGALLGALVGKNNGHAGEYALIGAGIGALAGGGAGLYMDKQESALREHLRSTGVSVTRNGKHIILNMPGNVTFASSESNISPKFYNTLNSVAVVLKKYNKTAVQIVGHTDSTGSNTTNQELSRSRANSVSQYLASQGINSQRLSSFGNGETKPIASNNTMAGREQNRRVEITLIPL